MLTIKEKKNKITWTSKKETNLFLSSDSIKTGSCKIQNRKKKMTTII